MMMVPRLYVNCKTDKRYQYINMSYLKDLSSVFTSSNATEAFWQSIRWHCKAWAQWWMASFKPRGFQGLTKWCIRQTKYSLKWPVARTLDGRFPYTSTTTTPVLQNKQLLVDCGYHSNTPTYFSFAELESVDGTSVLGKLDMHGQVSQL